jgi:hypothetical protein
MAPALLSSEDSNTQVTQTSRGKQSMTRAPWYMRQEFWIVMGTLFVPFFWVLPLSRAAYARVSVRRVRRF